MNIAILTPFLENTGNTISAKRIIGYLNAEGYKTYEFSTRQQIGTFNKFCVDKDIDLALGLHAHHSGKHLRESVIPNALLFCNTDLNCDYDDLNKRSIIDSAVKNAKLLLCYHNEFKNRLLRLYPERAGDIKIVGKSTRTSPSQFSLKKALNISKQQKLLLLPSGIRNIKDPLFLLPAFEALGRINMELVLIGNLRDEKYAESVRKHYAKVAHAHFLEAIDVNDLHAVIVEADVVINTSLYEGIPNVLLEAMQLQTPVVARNIAGNTELVVHGETGLVFNTPDEAFQMIDKVINDVNFSAKLSAKASIHIKQYYSPELEKKNYLEVVSAIASCL